MKLAEPPSSESNSSDRLETVRPSAARPDPTARPRLDLPQAARPVTIVWKYAISITVIHLLALLAFLPYYFSWTGVVLALVGHYVYGLFGITLGYHRLLTHQGLVVPKWFERFCATCGVCSLEDTPARWVAIHRMHHKHSDEQDDPHTPLVNFLWSHVGWLMIRHREHSTIFFYEKYARDILRDPYYLWLERDLAWFLVYMLHAVVYFAAGFGAGWLLTGNVMGGVQFGASCLIWGVCVRTVTVWHGSWMVNSLTHVIGYRNYETKDLSRNQWFVALWAHGEGWHNNHHHDQRSAVHGHKWWEFDPTWCVIRVLMALGIAKEVVMPRAWTKTSEPAPGSAPKTSAPKPAAEVVKPEPLVVKPEPVALRNLPPETELPAPELAPVKAA